ncbi:histidine ammonia-lyase [Bdellovibrio bacteriovorus]|uniref:Histidine ammonia-lyase n=1 Tax=Bdellovibrio bacteriovorus TaxID=959 RepID=A0A150WFP1_BDEBC|nr:histidine ammonia-lyase [Bdellovibrio bacteriovorus]KYG61784.1 histidine ammonia-lyase [Bdellovibrio bacteriovorus]KYG67937.1 histidine ammonia-lyase [Bdellovibrio bacteriovorus]
MQINGENITLENLYQIATTPSMKVELAASGRAAMQKSRSYIEGRISSGEVMYGVNTGFGAFSSVRISDAEIEQLQRNLIRSHSVGVGTPFTKKETRAMMVLRANALAKGHSGIRPLVVDKILEFLNNDIIPVVPSQGSVGASGDLAPLSHLALTIIGEGLAWGKDGQAVDVRELLKEKNIEPLELKAKEGLSMINGCQVMTSVGLLSLWEARRLLWLADIAGAMSLEGLRGTRKAFDPLISATRPHPGEAKTARNLMKILGETSQISESHSINDPRVQDAYSLRCMPAVHGAAKDALRYVVKVLETEANSSTDNPLVFADENKVLSCGNFHGMPVAHAMDFAGIAISSQASISECRISKMISTQMSELPAFLTPNGGLNSGHMIVQVAAASLVSENKVLAHPASVDSIPTSAEKEDHVSMGTIAARKFAQILRNAEHVVAMELLSACQAIDMLAPLQPNAAVKAVFDHIRKTVPYAKEDRIFYKDIEAIKAMMLSNELVTVAEKAVGPMEW